MKSHIPRGIVIAIETSSEYCKPKINHDIKSEEIFIITNTNHSVKQNAYE